MPNELLYGFRTLEDRQGERASLNGTAVRDAIVMTLAEHNAGVEQLLGLFGSAARTPKELVRQDGTGSLQEGDEFQLPDPIRTTIYDVGFDLRMGQRRWGLTWVEAEKATIADVDRSISTLLRQDLAYVRRGVLSHILDKDGYTFQDPEFGSLSVKPFANGDNVAYFKMGADAKATDNHYVAQEAAISNAANPLNDWVQDLTEHPENSGDVVAFVATNVANQIQGLAEFVQAPIAGIQPGVNEATVVGPIGISHPGMYLGKTRSSMTHVIEWKHLPAGYGFIMATGGEKPLGIREDAEESLRGFRARGMSETFPYFDEDWARRIGFGARNRAGVVAFRVGGATYATPTGFTLA